MTPWPIGTMSAVEPVADTARDQALYRRCKHMPTELIVVFLLLFAVLAFGWFYWQRAKGRPTTTTVTTEPAEPTDTTPAS